MSNPGGYHHVLFNPQDARQLSEQALEEALMHGVRPIIGSAAAHLIVIYDALGRSRARRGRD